MVESVAGRSQLLRLWRVPLGKIDGELTDAFAGDLGDEYLDVVAELEQLAY